MGELIWVGNTLYPRWIVFAVFVAVILLPYLIAAVVSTIRRHKGAKPMRTDLSIKLRNIHELAADSCDPVLIEVIADIERRAQDRGDCQVVMDAQGSEIERLRAIPEQLAKMIEGFNQGQIRMAGGEMTAQEMRTVQAVQRWWVSAIRHKSAELLNQQQTGRAALDALTEETERLGLYPKP